MCGAAAALAALCTAACVSSTAPTALGDPCPLHGFAAESRQVVFAAQDGTPLAGQLDLPDAAPPHPTVVVLHHSGPVDRCAYDYMAQLLVENGFAVFRFDKRGTGRSGGVYGCCEADDAVAAWRAAAQPGVDTERLYLMAQSLGTRIAADRFAEIAAIQPPRGLLLLSSLLDGGDLERLSGPILLVLSASEPNLAANGEEAAERYRRSGGAIRLYVAEGTEHTLFDTTEGPLNWDDPAWRSRFHTGAAGAIVGWLREQVGLPHSMREAVWRV